MSRLESGPRMIVAIGECMLELSDRPEGCRLGFGGDTLNTALYLARLGIVVEYVTALGDDPYSDWMIAQWRSEGIGTRFVRREKGRLPGLYAIRTDTDGERRFYYWRQNAPARELLKKANAGSVSEALSAASLIYLSGITVSILDEEQRRKFLELLAASRARNAAIAFDPNYRPAGWPDAAAARRWFDDFYRLSTHALPSIDDERALGVPADPFEVIDRLHRLGVGEVVVKCSRNGCWTSTGEGARQVPARHAKCVDSTAAGDSFNAGYLAARMNDMAPETAAALGHRLASAVIAHAGAIIPADAMPKLSL